MDDTNFYGIYSDERGDLYGPDMLWPEPEPGDYLPPELPADMRESDERDLVWYPYTKCGGVTVWETGRIIDAKKRSRVVYVLIEPQDYSRAAKWIVFDDVLFINR